MAGTRTAYHVVCGAGARAAYHVVCGAGTRATYHVVCGAGACTAYHMLFPVRLTDSLLIYFIRSQLLYLTWSDIIPDIIVYLTWYLISDH